MGIMRVNMRKYSPELTWPMVMKGSSTNCPPIQVRTDVVAISAQNSVFAIGRNIRDRSFEVWVRGIRSKTKIDSKRARTPPSLFGIERRMA